MEEWGGHEKICNLLVVKQLVARVCLTHVWKGGAGTKGFVTYWWSSSWWPGGACPCLEGWGGHERFCNLLVVKQLVARVCLTHVWKSGAGTRGFVTT